ncbi:MAG: DUF2971 domain-containing protein [Verrucomicrobiaceae bacterium]|nr:MAG: DUF2971 domain-containing protein [Verrucomicrobiaceae bacterium]
MDAHTDFEAIDAESERMIDELTFPLPPPPVYHYTDTNGLRGIFENKALWATNYRFLNDASEMVYARELFEEVALNLEATQSDERAKLFLEACRNLDHQLKNQIDAYLVCFCDKPDLLNQWRDYCSTGGGYYVKFHGPDVFYALNEFQPNVARGMGLKVCYDREDQWKYFEYAIRSHLDHWMKYGVENTQSADPKFSLNFYKEQLSFKMSWASLAFKHPAFELENEWRFCALKPAGHIQGIKFRTGAYGLTPYLVCPLTNPPTNTLMPIEEIGVGPCSDADSAKLAVNLLLAIHNYASIPVVCSKIPVRHH